MSERKKVESATDAIRIAKQAAAEAGVVFPFVSEAKKEGDAWKVEVTSLVGAYEVTIVSSSGAVSEWKPVPTSSRR